MTGGEAFGGEVLLHDRIEFEQTQCVGDGGAGAADLLSDLFLGEFKFFGEAGVSTRLFDGIEAGALEVFDEGELKDLAVGSFADDDGKFVEAGFFGGAPAAFASDDFVFSRGAFTDDERLDDALGADAVGEFCQCFFREVFAWLERTGDKLIPRKSGELLARLRLGICDGRGEGVCLFAEQRVESASEFFGSGHGF